MSNVIPLSTLPSPVARLIAGEMVDHITPDNRLVWRNEWKPPRIISVAERRMVEQAYRALRKRMAPAPAADVLDRVSVLLARYGQCVSTPAQRDILAHDWRWALDDLPGWTLDEAARRWLRSNTKRPTPADIRRLADEASAMERQQIERLEQLLQVPYSTTPEPDPRTILHAVASLDRGLTHAELLRRYGYGAFPDVDDHKEPA